MLGQVRGEQRAEPAGPAGDEHRPLGVSGCGTRSTILPVWRDSRRNRNASRRAAHVPGRDRQVLEHTPLEQGDDLA